MLCVCVRARVQECNFMRACKTAICIELRLSTNVSSLQDTLIAMQALAAYAEIRHENDSILIISVKSSEEDQTQSLQIQNDQANVRQTINVSWQCKL